MGRTFHSRSRQPRRSVFFPSVSPCISPPFSSVHRSSEISYPMISTSEAHCLMSGSSSFGGPRAIGRHSGSGRHTAGRVASVIWLRCMPVTLRFIYHAASAPCASYSEQVAREEMKRVRVGALNVTSMPRQNLGSSHTPRLPGSKLQTSEVDVEHYFTCFG